MYVELYMYICSDSHLLHTYLPVVARLFFRRFDVRFVYSATTESACTCTCMCTSYIHDVNGKLLTANVVATSYGTQMNRNCIDTPIYLHIHVD